MISLRDIAGRCVRLTGSFSILRDFYGYTTIPKSIIFRTATVRLLINGEHIIVHPKIGFYPVNFTVDEMMDAMRVVFGDYSITVIVRQTENLTLPPELQDVDVGTCQLGSVTTEQTHVFNNRNNVGNNEIVIYFVHDTPGFDGCASYPPNRPGAIVVAERCTSLGRVTVEGITLV